MGDDNPFAYNPLASTARAGASFIDILQFVVLGVAILVVLYLFMIIPTQVDGQSMETNFHNDEVLLSNRLIQIIGGPGSLFANYNYVRGDVVVFSRPDEPDLIKRVIALPGEKVMIKGTKVYVNGQLLPEPYINVDRPTEGGTFISEGVEKTVPNNSYFLLGDNRTNSKDSRDATVGFVKREQIKGGPFVRVFPFNRFGSIERPKYN